MNTIKVEFSTLGLSFEAEGVYLPGSCGTYYDPPESAEFDFRSLTCEGQDASFLFNANPDISEELETAAIAAVERDSEQLRDEIRAEYAFN